MRNAMRFVPFAVLCLIVVAAAGHAAALGSGSLTVSGTGWVASSSTLATGLDLSTGQSALEGWVDVSAAAVVNPSDWSKYYHKVQLRDNAGKRVDVVFGEDWLGPWHEMAPQGWNRIRLENNLGQPQPETYYCTVGGQARQPYPNYTTIYPTDKMFFMQLLIDAGTRACTLNVYGNGHAGGGTPPNSANSTPGNKWWTIGSITLPVDFNLANVTARCELWASTQAAPGETTTVSWHNMQINGASAGAIPPPVVWVDDDYTAATPGWQVTRFDVIQDGINAVAAGGTVNVAAGAYARVTVNKSVDIIGAGNGAGDTVISGGGSTVVNVTASDVALQDLRITGGGHGVYTDSVISNLGLDGVVSTGNSTYGVEIHNSAQVDGCTIDNCAFTGNVTGMRVRGKLTGLVVSDSSFDGNSQGLNSTAQAGQNAPFDDVTISDTTFNNNGLKGIYVEKLSNATLTNITVDGSGNGASPGAGIDINLKYAAYSDISISNSVVSNCGNNSGMGIGIKARDDGAYAGSPATLDNVTLSGVTVTGGLYGVLVGEPGRLNVGPTNVTISGCTFGTNATADVGNVARAGNVVQAPGNTWGNGATTDAQIEEQVYHDVDVVGIGHVDWGQGAATATNLSVQNVSGAKGATVQLAARLTAGGAALAGQAVAISVDGAAVGAPVTDANGWARIDYTITQGAGAFDIDAAFGGVSNYKAATGRGTLTVTTPAPTSITVTMAPNPVDAGATSTATVMGDNGVDYSAAATCYIQYGAGGSWAGNVYTSAKAGTWTVTAVYGSLAATDTLTVNHGAASTVTLAPATASITTAQTQTYTVQATDAQGNSWTPAVGDITWAENGAGGFTGMVYTPAAGDGGNVVDITATVGGVVSNTAALTVISSGSGGTPLILAWDRDTATFYMCTDAANPQTGTALALGDNTVGGITVNVSKFGSSSTDLVATVTNAGAPGNSLRVRWYLRSGAVNKCYSYSTIDGTTHTAVYSLGRTSVDGGRSQVGFFGLAHNLNADPPTAITYSVVEQP